MLYQAFEPPQEVLAQRSNLTAWGGDFHCCHQRKQTGLHWLDNVENGFQNKGRILKAQFGVLRELVRKSQQEEIGEILFQQDHFDAWTSYCIMGLSFASPPLSSLPLIA